MHYEEEIMPYKKKAKSPSAIKAKHKHLYEPCVFEQPEDWWQHKHLRSGKSSSFIRSYCPICGKVGPCDLERWWVVRNIGYAFTHEPSEEAKLELNPQTRTLPTFYVDDPFAKYIGEQADEMKV